LSLCYDYDASDIASLARAAVDGDDEALDMFMWSKAAAAASPAKLSRAVYKKEACTFYIASDDGKSTIRRLSCQRIGYALDKFCVHGAIFNLLRLTHNGCVCHSMLYDNLYSHNNV